MEDYEEPDCSNGFHDLLPCGEVYYKLKRNASFLDWILGTQYNKSIMYSMIYCRFCADGLEIIVKDLVPVRTVKAVVHEMTSK